MSRPEFQDLDYVALSRPLLGLPAGTRGTVIETDHVDETVIVAFVDGDRRPLGVERVSADCLRPATR